MPNLLILLLSLLLASYSPCFAQSAQLWSSSIPQSSTYTGSAIFSHPTVADLDHDGQKDIIATLRTNDASAGVYVFGPSGAVKPGFPAIYSSLVSSSYSTNSPQPGPASCSTLPTIGNVIGDSTLEIVVGLGCANQPVGAGIVVISAQGTEIARLAPGEPFGIPNTAPNIILHDIDNDGINEIIAHSLQGRLYIWKHDGTNFNQYNQGWPLLLPIPQGYLPDIIIAENGTQKTLLVSTSSIQAYTLTGQLVWSSPIGLKAIAAADMTGDGTYDVLAVGPAGDGIAVINSSGTVLTTIPGTTFFNPSFGFKPVTIIDVENDGRYEIVATSTVGGGITIFRGDGTPLIGYPISAPLPGASYGINSGVADLDNDGFHDLYQIYRTNQAPPQLFFAATDRFGMPLATPTQFNIPTTLLPYNAQQGFAEWSQPATYADINNDGTAEILIGGSPATIAAYTLTTSQFNPHKALNTQSNISKQNNRFISNNFCRTAMTSLGNTYCSGEPGDISYIKMGAPVSVSVNSQAGTALCAIDKAAQSPLFIPQFGYIYPSFSLGITYIGLSTQSPNNNPSVTIQVPAFNPPSFRTIIQCASSGNSMTLEQNYGMQTVNFVP